MGYYDDDLNYSSGKKTAVRESRLAAIDRQIQRLQEEALRLSLLPPEPVAAEGPDEPSVIWFRKTFGSRSYTYAAVRTGNGRWYTTGSSNPQAYTWEQLIDWIGADTGVWWASSWEQM